VLLDELLELSELLELLLLLELSEELLELLELLDELLLELLLELSELLLELLELDELLLELSEELLLELIELLLEDELELLLLFCVSLAIWSRQIVNLLHGDNPCIFAISSSGIAIPTICVVSPATGEIAPGTLPRYTGAPGKRSTPVRMIFPMNLIETI